MKYSDISDAIVSEKADNIMATGADLLLGGDLGCLINMAGKLDRQGAKSAFSTLPKFWRAWRARRSASRRHEPDR